MHDSFYEMDERLGKNNLINFGSADFLSDGDNSKGSRRNSLF